MGAQVTSSDPEVSVVFPCLNEAETLEACVRRTLTALEGAGIPGEVVVADNGSTDGSQDIARRAGARVVDVPHRGYGNALRGGFLAARGRFLIHLDSDLSYPIEAIPRFVEELRRGPDLVMGSRLRGTIAPGAMPFLHRYVGTPVLTGISNLFFGCGVSDNNCGMRGLRRDAFDKLDLRTGGMEFASEMIIKASLLGLRIVEIPIDFAPDQRGRPPHLRTFRDGWRHLRFMLLFSPTWLFAVPGLLLTLGGAATLALVVTGADPRLGLATGFTAHAAVVLGVQTLLLGVASQGVAHLARLRGSSALARIFAWLTLERGLLIGGVLVAGGGGILGHALWTIADFMGGAGYVTGTIDVPSTRLALLAATIIVTGLQLSAGAFFMSLFSIDAPQRD